MASVKIDEGTKKETVLDMEDGEVILFVKPPKNLMARAIGMKTWNVTVVITNKRLAVIPQPPNKKNKQVESYYFNDIKGADEYSLGGKTEDESFAYFAINLGSGGKSSYEKGKKGEHGFFMVRATVSNLVLKFFSDLFKGSDLTKISMASYQTSVNYNEAVRTGASHYVEVSPNLGKIRDEAQNKDFSKLGHAQIRDYIVGVVNACVTEANA